MEAIPILRSREEQLVEHRLGEAIDVLLRRLYADEGMTQEQIAETLQVHLRTVVRWMAKYRIPTRDRRAVQPEQAA